MDPRILAQALQGFDPSPMLRARVQDERLRYADQVRGFNQPVVAHNGVTAALQGVLRGIEQYRARKGHEANLDEFYQEYEAREQARAEAQAQARMQQAEAARAAKMEERQFQIAMDDRKRALDGQERRDMKMFEWQNKPPAELSPQDLLQMQQIDTQIQSIKQQMQMRESDNSRKDAKAEREATEAANMQEQKSNTDAMLADRIESLLSPERAKDLERATGSIESMLPSFRQGTVDAENDFKFIQSALTAEKLDMMTGVLSESDIRMLRELAAGGISLSSSEPRVREALSNFYQAITGNQVPSAGVDIDALVNKYADPQ